MNHEGFTKLHEGLLKYYLPNKSLIGLKTLILFKTMKDDENHSDSLRPWRI